MGLPVISIVIPAYNIADYLGKCLDSVLAQTYTALEIIVVNDGSTDDTVRVLDAYAEKDPRIKAIHKENGGVTSARFRGIAEATGEWIGFVDGDDAVDADMYERLYNNAVKYEADISHCGHRVFLANGEERFFYDTGRLVQQDKRTGIADLLEGAFVEPGLCSKLFRRQLFHRLLHTDEMDLTIKNNEDLLMNVILFKDSRKAVYEDFCPYQYYLRQNSATQQKLREFKVFDPVRVRERIVEILPNELQEEAKCSYVVTCINVYNDLFSWYGAEAKQYQNRVREILTSHFDRVQFANSKYRVMAQCIRLTPWFYHWVYRVYARTIRKKKYE